MWNSYLQGKANKVRISSKGEDYEEGSRAVLQPLLGLLDIATWYAIRVVLHAKLVSAPT